MTVKGKKRVNQPLLNTNKKLTKEFVNVIDKKSAKNTDEKNPNNLTCGSGIIAQWHCYDIFPGTENQVCNHEWFAVIKDRALKGQGCPSCSGNEVTSNNCLATHRPDLAAEWDYNKNDKTPDQVTKSSQYLAHWQCHECTSSWHATVNDRYNGKNCPFCACKIATTTNNLAFKFPETSAQLHPDCNIIPGETLPFSNKPAFWLCPDCNNEWHAIISSRTKQGSGCPRCRPQKSKLEMRILAELRFLFAYIWTIESGRKFGKSEADIFIPNINMVIEYDGTYYHQDIHKDEKKNNFFENQGLLLLRVRGHGLPKIRDHDVITENKREIKKFDTNKILDAICSIVNLSEAIKQIIGNYQKHKELQGDNEYYLLIENMNRPKHEFSMAAYPRIVAQWGTKNKLKPEQVAHKSNGLIFLQCLDENQHSEWTRTASDLTRTDERQGNLNCPHCCNKALSADCNLTPKFPNAA